MQAIELCYAPDNFIDVAAFCILECGLLLLS